MRNDFALARVKARAAMLNTRGEEGSSCIWESRLLASWHRHRMTCAMVAIATAEESVCMRMSVSRITHAVNEC